MRRIAAPALALVLLLPLAAHAAGRSGTYSVVPPVNYSCSALGMPVESVSFSSVEIFDADPALTIDPQGTNPLPMLGNIAEPAFFVQSSVAGGCTVTHQMSGAFSGVNSFNATYSITFIGAQCGLSDCIDQQFSISGTRPLPVPALSTAALALCAALIALAVGYRLSRRPR